MKRNFIYETPRQATDGKFEEGCGELSNDWHTRKLKVTGAASVARIKLLTF